MRSVNNRSLLFFISFLTRNKYILRRTGRVRIKNKSLNKNRIVQVQHDYTGIEQR